MYDDSEEEFDEEEEEYVYRRQEAPSVQLDLDELVIAQPASHASDRAPASKLAVHTTQSSPNLPEAFLRLLDQIKKLKDVSVLLLPKGAQFTIEGPKTMRGDPALILRADVDDAFPKSSLHFHLLPARDVSASEMRLLPHMMEEAIAKHNKEVLGEIISLLRTWLHEPSIRQRQEEADREEQRVKEEAAAKAQEEKERLLDEQWEAEQRRKLEARIPAWRPLSAHEIDQQPPLDGNAPSKVLPQLALPRVRSFSAARVRGRIFFYGGYIDEECSDELCVFHIASQRIERYVPDDEDTEWPRAIRGHASIAVGDSVFILGGETRQGRAIDEVYELDTNTLKWKRRTKMPVSLAYHTATAMGSRSIVLFGGLNSQTKYQQDVLLYDVLYDRWKYPVLKPLLAPAARYGHSAVLFQNKLVIYGGQGVILYGDVWVLDLDTWIWQGPVPFKSEPGPRTFHSTCLVGGHMVVYGGEYTEGRQLNDLVLVDLINRDARTKPLQHLDARSRHVAVLTGGTMFIVGGADAQVLFKFQPSTRRYTTAVSKAHKHIEFAPPLAIVLTPAIIVVPPGRYIRDITELRTAPSSFTDLKVGPQALPVHSFLLCARCPALTTAVSAVLAASSPGSSVVQFSIPELVSAEANRAFIDYIYTGNPYYIPEENGALWPPPELIAELSHAARKFELPQMGMRVTSVMYSVNTFPQEVSEDLARQADAPFHPDFVLVAGGKRFPVHRALLVCRSQYFEAMLASGMSEATTGQLVLPNTISEVAGKALRGFFYSDELDPECAEHVTELLPFALMAQLPRLTRTAERLITDAYDLTDLDSVLTLTAVASTHHAPMLLSRCMFLIVQHFTLSRAREAAGWAALGAELQKKVEVYASNWK